MLGCDAAMARWVRGGYALQWASTRQSGSGDGIVGEGIERWVEGRCGAEGTEWWVRGLYGRSRDGTVRRGMVQCIKEQYSGSRNCAESPGVMRWVWKQDY